MSTVYFLWLSSGCSYYMYIYIYTILWPKSRTNYCCRWNPNSWSLVMSSCFVTVARHRRCTGLDPAEILRCVSTRAIKVETRAMERRTNSMENFWDVSYNEHMSYMLSTKDTLVGLTEAEIHGNLPAARRWSIIVSIGTCCYFSSCFAAEKTALLLFFLLGMVNFVYPLDFTLKLHVTLHA